MKPNFMKQKNIIKFLIFLIMISLNSCKQQKEDNFEFERIDFKSLMRISDIGLPLEFIAAGDTLFISDFYGDSLVHVYDLNQKVKINQIINKGNGPGEVMPPIKLSLINDSIFVYSRPIFGLFEGVRSLNPELKLKTLVPTRTMNIFSLGNNLFIASQSAFNCNDNFSSDRFLALDSLGNISYSFGEYPKFLPMETNMNEEVLSNFHQTNSIFFNKDGDLIATGPYDISFYSKDGEKKFKLKKMLKVADYDYEYNEGTQLMSARTKIKDGSSGNIIGSVPFKEYIVLGKLVQEYPVEENIIEFLIYDNQGEFIKKLKPDHKVEAPFCITDAGEIIAIYNNENDTYLYKSSPLDLRR